MMIRLFPLRPILAALILCLPAAASRPACAAAPIDDAGAARLKTMLDDLLATQMEGPKAQGVKVQTDGPVKVDKANGYYAATLPAYTLSDPDSGLSVSFGRVAINATASDTPRQWNMAVALPASIRMKTPDHGDITLSIGAQKTSGVWHEDLRNFVKLDSQINTIQIVNSAKTFTLSIPSVTSIYDLTDKGGDSWSGPANVIAKGLTLNAVLPDQVSPLTLVIDDIAIKSTVRDLSIKAMSEYRDQIEALSVTAGTDPNLPFSPAHAEATVKLLADLFRNAWDGFSGEFSLHGLRLETPAIQTPGSSEPARSIQLREGHFAMDTAGFRSGKVSLGVRIGHDGLEVVPEPQDLGPLMPTSTALDLRLENLPFRELVDLGLGSFKMAQQMPGMEQMVGLQVLASLPKLMSAAGTRVTFHENRLAGKLYNVLINGQMVADSSATNGLTAKGRMEIAGFEAVLTYLNGKLEKSSEQERNDLANYIGNLTTLQALGQQAKNAAGQDIRAYDFVMDPQGRMLLNGADFNALAGTRGQGAQPQSAPPTSGKGP